MTKNTFNTSTDKKGSLDSASLEQWLEHLLAIHPTEIDMGLTRVSHVASKLGLLDLGETQVITVAGTNGKGTTCAMLESILVKAGMTVGVYSSPHIHQFNERYRINQLQVTDKQIIAAFNAIERERENTTLTYFEFATLASLWIFKQAKLDVVLLEVGLGGRLDATNIIDSVATIITAIDIDHQEYLGDTRELVGREKAGVMRSHCLSVIGEADLPQSVLNYATEIGANVARVGQEFRYQISSETTWLFSDEHGELNHLPIPSLPLPNAATTVALIRQLWPQITPETIKQGLAAATLPGRIEQVSATPLVLLDVAHNPHAAEYLASQLSRYKGRKIHALCGMLQDKDIALVLQCLTHTIEQWNFVSLDNPRGAKASVLGQALSAALEGSDLSGDNGLPQALQFETMENAWQSIKTTIDAEDVLIVFGSFFTVAAFHQLLKTA